MTELDPAPMSMLSVGPKCASAFPTPCEMERRGPRKIAGKVYIDVGPMFSGKTSAMSARLTSEQLAGNNILVVKFAQDDRYGTPTSLVTHGNHILEAGRFAPDGAIARFVSVAELKDVELTATDQVIAVDEGQFFPDLDVAAEAWAASGRKVFVAALNGDSNRQPFAPVSALYAHADHITHHRAVCACGAKASFTRRLAPGSGILIGGSEAYRAACRSCHSCHTSD